MKVKVLNILVLLNLGFLLFSCNDSASRNEKEASTIYNLFDRGNTEIPSECRPPLATEQEKLEFVRFRGKVNRCVTMTNNSDDLNTYQIIDECIDQVGRAFKAVSNMTCRQTVLHNGEGSATAVMFNLLDNYFIHNIVDLNTTDLLDWTGMTNYFNLIGRWFNHTRGYMYPVDGAEFISEAHFVDFENKINAPLWKAISGNDIYWKESFGEIIKPVSPTDGDGNPLSDEMILKNQINKNKAFQVYKTMLKVNNKFLINLFASDLAKDIYTWKEGRGIHASPLLASFLGDALSPLFERMQVIMRIYDIACKLKTCTHGFYEKNSAYWLLRFMNSIATGEDMAGLAYKPNNIELADFLNTIEANQDVVKSLIAGVNESLGVTNFSSVQAGSDFPKILDTFKKIFDQTYTLLSNYNNSKLTQDDGTIVAGYFSSDSIADINVGFSSTNIDRHIKSVENSNQKLIALKKEYESKKHTLIAETLSYNGSQITLQDLSNSINDMYTDIVLDSEQIDAIRNYISKSSEDYAKEVQALILKASSDSSGTGFALERERRFSLEARAIPLDKNDGKLEGIYMYQIPSVAMRKGDILQFNVENEWSPVCAITKFYGDELVNAKTGPRGFALTHTEGKSKVHSVNNFETVQTTKSVGVSASACVGYGSKGMRFWSAQACVTASISKSWTNGKTTSDLNSNSSRSDASFDLGLTLPGTPYPELPVGSLILVEMAPGVENRYEYRNVYILKQNSSFVVSNSSSEYYLVGNDCYGSNNKGELFITMQHLRPQGELAAEYIEKISAVTKEVSERAKSLIEVGQLSFDMKESIKSQLKGSIGGTPLESFSGQIRNLLDSYIMNEIAILGYKSQLVQMERSLDVKMAKLMHLLDQFNSQSQQVELHAYTRNWLLSNLDMDFMNKTEVNQDLYNLNKILSTLENNLVSYLDFKYRNDEKEHILGNLDLLQLLDLADGFDHIAENLSTFVQVLIDNIREDLENNPKVPKTVVGLKIPNPYYEPTFDLPFPDFSLFPVMNETKAKIFWDNLLNWENIGEKDLAFNVEIDDLYADEGLGCYVQTPIIETMGMFFIPENEGYITDFNNSYQFQNAKLYLDGLSYMPFEDKLREYNFVNENWRYMDAAVRMAKSDDDAMHRLTTEFPPETQTETGLATGRPPFGKFIIGKLRPWRNYNGQILIGRTPVTEIKELFLGYVISANNSNYNVNLGWLSRCMNDHL